MVEQYFRVLEISSSSTLEQIKKAYRKKAKELHPDRNPSPTAHEDFIQVNEAYEYLVKYKTGKLYSNLKRGFTRPTRSNEEQEKYWREKAREQARARARKHAQMEYEAYTKTEYYKNTQAAVVLLGFLLYFFAALVSVIVPLLGVLLHGWLGLAVGSLISLTTAKFWLGVFYFDPPEVELRDFLPAFRRLLGFKSLWAFISLILSIIIFLRVGLNTVISLNSLFAIYTISFIPGLIWSFKKSDAWTRVLKVVGIGPILVSVFLGINYQFSGDPYEETYSYHLDSTKTVGRRGPYNYDSPPENGKRRKVPSTLIILESNAYKEEKGIRIFADINQLVRYNHITYYFEKGLFGLSVVKDTHFFRLYE